MGHLLSFRWLGGCTCVPSNLHLQWLTKYVWIHGGYFFSDFRRISPQKDVCTWALLSFCVLDSATWAEIKGTEELASVKMRQLPPTSGGLAIYKAVRQKPAHEHPCPSWSWVPAACASCHGPASVPPSRAARSSEPSNSLLSAINILLLQVSQSYYGE